jgi:predicted porin
MNKILLTAAVLFLFAGTASAQSSITIYGVVDMSITKSNSGTSVNPGRGTPGAWEMQDAYGSRLGFKGVEDLGNGRYARFQLETRFNPDTGEQAASTFWQGRSVVALGDKKYGELYLGREYIPAFWVSCTADPTCYSYVSEPGFAYTLANYNGSVSMDGSAIRRSNTVGYKSPNLNGLTSEATISLGEGNRKNTAGLNVQYKNGPLYAGFGYDGRGTDNRVYIVAASYDVGVVKPIVSYTDAKGGATPTYAAKAATFSLVAPVAGGQLFGGIGHLNTNAAANNNSNKLYAGYVYPLSKRTSVYTNVGSAKTTDLDRSTAYDVGITHTF